MYMNWYNYVFVVVVDNGDSSIEAEEAVVVVCSQCCIAQGYCITSLYTNQYITLRHYYIYKKKGRQSHRIFF